jgi:hypothetical protein
MTIEINAVFIFREEASDVGEVILFLEIFGDVPLLPVFPVVDDEGEPPPPLVEVVDVDGEPPLVDVVDVDGEVTPPLVDVDEEVTPALVDVEDVDDGDELLSADETVDVLLDGSEDDVLDD